ncbi:Delta-like protein [Caenorhabditis elegans]|uniref:Delta-like protein n=1 Tax=Caenorhabditis elegans TaxID=6239 RepID=A0A486WTV8_CAEEL|nr:Delta-like protein [Caenorhabditis elegans]VGM69568.1 Delta-like protein [Caenorhabditis elegans]
MTNFSSLLTTIFLCIISSATGSGTIELLISSPQTVLVEPTVCANFECAAPDDLSLARKVQRRVPLRFGTGQYHGEARERIDLHLKIIEPTSNEILALQHHRPAADTEWNSDAPIVIETSRGFNVTVQLRNLCSSNYHGKRCNRYCIANAKLHWECSTHGVRRCSAGWSGEDCSNPICAGGCSNRGRCVAPNQCSCADGFNGTRCEQCLPRAGCVNGDCVNETPNTCKCRDGFIGDRCDIDIKICSLEKPCANGGICSIDSSSSTGYKCHCPFEFVGSQCKTPLSKVRCSAEHVCKNGGACISMDDTNIQCKCRRGFSGKFCEIGNHGDCSAMRCSAGETCQISGDFAICVENDELLLTTNKPAETTKSVEKWREPRKTANDEQASDELQLRLIAAICVLFCVIGLALVSFFFYMHSFSKWKHPSSQQAGGSTILPTTTSIPMSTTSSGTGSPVYKVCIIDSEHRGNAPGSSSDSEPDHHCPPPHRHSPPPAYSSLVLYKKVPMAADDESSFRV